MVTEDVRLMEKKAKNQITPESQKCRLKCSREAIKDEITFLGTSRKFYCFGSPFREFTQQNVKMVEFATTCDISSVWVCKQVII